MDGQFAADNFVSAVKVNGTDVPGFPLGSLGDNQHLDHTPFTIPPGNWVSGTNTIEFRIINWNGPSAQSQLGLSVMWGSCYGSSDPCGSSAGGSSPASDPSSPASDSSSAASSGAAADACGDPLYECTTDPDCLLYPGGSGDICLEPSSICCGTTVNTCKYGYIGCTGGAVECRSGICYNNGGNPMAATCICNGL